MRSRKADSAVWCMTTSRPGPGSYATAPPACGPQLLSTRPSVSHVAFSSQRDRKDGANILPSYSRGAIYFPTDATSLGEQSLAGRVTAAKALIGTSTREAALIQYSIATYKPQ